MVFRFDDVSGNSNMKTIYSIADLLWDKFPECIIICGMSPITHVSCGERVFPSILNARSDYREFYEVDCCEIPKFSGALFAGHGLIHMDHRLLDYQAQEMSILVSCSLAKGKIFIPPFNKWNELTEQICKENEIELIKFEDGWKSAEHNTFDATHKLWYLHPYAWTVDKFKEWLEK